MANFFLQRNRYQLKKLVGTKQKKVNGKLIKCKSFNILKSKTFLQINWTVKMCSSDNSKCLVHLWFCAIHTVVSGAERTPVKRATASSMTDCLISDCSIAELSCVWLAASRHSSASAAWLIVSSRPDIGSVCHRPHTHIAITTGDINS